MSCFCLWAFLCSSGTFAKKARTPLISSFLIKLTALLSPRPCISGLCSLLLSSCQNHMAFDKVRPQLQPKQFNVIISPTHWGNHACVFCRSDSWKWGGVGQSVQWGMRNLWKRERKYLGVGVQGDSNGQDGAGPEQYFPSPRKTLHSHSFLSKDKELSPGFRRSGDPKSGFN